MSVQGAAGRVRLHVALHSAAFLLGVSMVFISFGLVGGFIGELLFDYGDALRIGAGVLLIFFGALTLRLVPLPLLQRDFRAHMATKPPGYAGSVLVGLAFGAGWSPCIGPILAGIITVAGAQGSALEGGALLGVYSLGFALPFFLAAQALPLLRKFNRYSAVLEKLSGALLILVGAVLLTGSVNSLSSYLASLGSLESVLGAFPGNSGEAVPLTLYPLALLAGALSFLSPCVLPILPSFLAYLTGVTATELLNPS